MSFASFAAFKAALQRKVLNGSVWVAPHTVAALTDICTTGGALGPLTGHVCMGKLTSDGVTFSDTPSLQADRGLGDAYPSRQDVESEDLHITFAAMQSMAAVFDEYFGVDQTAVTPLTTGTITFQAPPLPVIRDRRVLALFVDNNADGTGEIYMGLYLPRANITKNGDQAYQFASPGITYSMQATALNDDTLGTPFQPFWGGPGLASLVTEMGY